MEQGRFLDSDLCAYRLGLIFVGLGQSRYLFR